MTETGVTSRKNAREQMLRVFDSALERSPQVLQALVLSMVIATGIEITAVSGNSILALITILATIPGINMLRTPSEPSLPELRSRRR